MEHSNGLGDTAKPRLGFIGLGNMGGRVARRLLAAGFPLGMYRRHPDSLRALVDLFPTCGAIASAAALVGGLAPGWQRPANMVLGISGALPLIGWALGITRLPPGANPEVGLWVIALGAAAVLGGLALELAMLRRHQLERSPDRASDSHHSDTRRYPLQ